MPDAFSCLAPFFFLPDLQPWDMLLERVNQWKNGWMELCDPNFPQWYIFLVSPSLFLLALFNWVYSTIIYWVPIMSQIFLRDIKKKKRLNITSFLRISQSGEQPDVWESCIIEWNSNCSLLETHYVLEIALSLPTQNLLILSVTPQGSIIIFISLMRILKCREGKGLVQTETKQSNWRIQCQHQESWPLYRYHWMQRGTRAIRTRTLGEINFVWVECSRRENSWGEEMKREF